MPKGLFNRFSNAVSRGAGNPVTFTLAAGVVALWAVSGPMFGYSSDWQLVINTGTTIVTFLMVFVLQHTQNRDGEAVQAKLDELILAVKKADNRFIGAEELSGHELRRLRQLIADELAETASDAAPAAGAEATSPLHSLAASARNKAEANRP